MARRLASSSSSVQNWLLQTWTDYTTGTHGGAMALLCAPCVEMNLWQRLKFFLGAKPLPEHLEFGKLGERAAKKELKRLGLKFLTANFRSPRGEIDLVFREMDCLVFVEVKTRSSEDWMRPAAAVDAERRRRLTRAGLDYLRLLRNPQVKVRFDIVEVLLENGAVREVRHLPNSFEMARPHRYG